MISEQIIIFDSDPAPDGFYKPGALYAIWDTRNRIIGEYLGHHAAYGLPEFRPLIWEGLDAEPLRHVCAGPRARVKLVDIQKMPQDAEITQKNLVQIMNKVE
mgnify:CR=1 FL=1